MFEQPKTADEIICIVTRRCPDCKVVTNLMNTHFALRNEYYDYGANSPEKSVYSGIVYSIYYLYFLLNS